MLPFPSPADWNRMVARLPHAHLLQSWEWGEFKSRHGWSARRLEWPEAAAAQVLQRRLARGLPFASILYIPRGPLLDWADTARRGRVLDDLQALARQEAAIFIKIDPGLPLAAGPEQDPAPDPTGPSVQAELERRGWRFSPSQVQFRNTVTLDLAQDEAALLGGMKPKTRYNIRLAERKGVRVRPGSTADLDLLYRMYAETSVRDSFIIRSPAYYRDAWGSFMETGLARPFIAEVEAEAVGALIVYAFAGTAWYLYGMSRDVHREKMPNHLLQWEAMRWARAQGCTTYDFWGAPDEFVEADPLWGVWKFKAGFGGQVVHGLGAWDYTPFPRLYRFYTVTMPRILDFMRRRGQRRTRESLG